MITRIRRLNEGFTDDETFPGQVVEGITLQVEGLLGPDATSKRIRCGTHQVTVMIQPVNDAASDPHYVDIAQRVDDGSSTPVLVSHLDALDVRDAIAAGAAAE